MGFTAEQVKQMQDRVAGKATEAKKQLKFRNVKTEVDGEKFDSKKEAERYGILKLLEQRGDISGLERQVTYRLEVNGQLIAKYIADFVFIQDGIKITEDVKSKHTRTLPVYRMKKKLMFALFGITIKEY